jgi:drug/metabolite transporter (DMT)-like permease
LLEQHDPQRQISVFENIMPSQIGRSRYNHRPSRPAPGRKAGNAIADGSSTGLPSDDGSRSAGSLIVAVSAIAFSTAGLFTRLIATDVLTMLLWRGLFGGLLIGAYIVWQERAATRAAFAAIGWAGLLTSSCSTVGAICFVAALRETTVADVTAIYATAPFGAAVIAWAWTSEHPRPTTLVASGLALLGVLIMCGGVTSMGQSLGDLLALAMTVLMALMMVVIRRNQQVSMLPAACLSALTRAIAVIPWAHPFALTREDLALLALFGTTQFGTGLLLLTVDSRLISAPRASLLVNLELPFAPLWVWLAFDEVPSWLTFVGGGIVWAAVLLDIAADQRRSDQRTREVSLSAPASCYTMEG